MLKVKVHTQKLIAYLLRLHQNSKKAPKKKHNQTKKMKAAIDIIWLILKLIYYSLESFCKLFSIPRKKDISGRTVLITGWYETRREVLSLLDLVLEERCRWSHAQPNFSRLWLKQKQIHTQNSIKPVSQMSSQIFLEVGSTSKNKNSTHKTVSNQIKPISQMSTKFCKCSRLKVLPSTCTCRQRIPSCTFFLYEMTSLQSVTTAQTRFFTKNLCACQF